MLFRYYKYWCLSLVVVLVVSCAKNSADNLSQDKLFTEVPIEISGVTFENKILESERLHYYKYLYIYIGGGVAAADFNNDGLQDLFFTSNIYHNRLFLNKGNFKFEDITIKAGIEKRPGFDVGVSIADVNNDGFLDIYINRAGWYNGEEKLANMLYINNGDLTFTEKAKAHGLAETNRSIASTFFDYDKDGDLDVYIANAPSGFNLSGQILDLKKIQTGWETKTYKSSDKLYENDGNGHFTDVSKKAGILPDLGFGLNAQVGDLNNDGWPDVYVSNDFITPDFAYINNGDGTFTDKRNDLFKHIPYYSMGADVADINNDGLTDLFVLDMSPEDYVRSKTTMSMMSIDRFNDMINNDYHYQYMHNMMQLNNGKDNFSEVSNLSGVAKTDWSWAALFADFDLDGYNDLYITNGIYRDVVDRDINNEINKYINENKGNLLEKDFYNFTQKLPQQRLKNYLFKNNGNLKFSNETDNWSGLKETFSNGAVYVDLDNDGDLDLVTSNLDEPATILKNNSRELNKGNYLQISFKGQKNNAFGVGTKVKLYTSDGATLFRELINSRGYLSALPNQLHFGLGKEKTVEKIEVIWSDGNEQVLENVAVNQSLEVTYKKQNNSNSNQRNFRDPLFVQDETFDFSHKEKIFNDFNVQLLLPHKLSQLGPAIAKTDLNKDGVDDIYIGGAHTFEGQLLISTKNEGYKNITVRDFKKDKLHEDVHATFFDADNDGDDDLYVVSGSYEFNEGSQLLEDRLYINKGNFNFVRSKDRLPQIKTAGAVVIASDYDKDGDQDLFVGGRVIPGKYPYAPESTLLINEGGKFVDKTKELAPSIANIGMVTTAQWADIDLDQDQDLIISGEWMGIEVFTNENGNLQKNTNYESLSSMKGWWNKIVLDDVDQDGDLDIIAGNLGLNYKFHASQEKPFHVYTNDFDLNGTEDIVLAKHYNENLVPVRGKNCTSQKMPYLKERIKTFQEFANSNLQEILGETFESAIHLQAVDFRSGYFINNDNSFDFVPFPTEAQISPINSILYEDFNNDSIKDLVLAGNNYMSEVETTRSDAGIGVFLEGTKEGGFSYIENKSTGFYATNDVRNMVRIDQKNGMAILVANNNGKYQLFKK